MPRHRMLDAVVATTDYGVEFASMLWRDNLYATQFHPEKSQHWGLRLLAEFFALSQGRGMLNLPPPDAVAGRMRAGNSLH